MVLSAESVSALLSAGVANLVSPRSCRPPVSRRDALLDAEVLLAHSLNRSATWLLGHGDDRVTAAVRAHYLGLIARRAAGEPVAYLTGYKEFWSLRFEVAAGVFVPRPETELLVEQALRQVEAMPCRAGGRVTLLELGTGCGAVGLALASELPAAGVTLTDVSAPALALARRNAAQQGLPRVAFAHGSWYAAVAGQQFDLIVANPPYIDRDDAQLQWGVEKFEPAPAIFAADAGLRDLTTLISQAAGHLSRFGWLAVEHGYRQAAAVSDLFRRCGFDAVHTVHDLAGLERVTQGRIGGLNSVR